MTSSNRSPVPGLLLSAIAAAAALSPVHDAVAQDDPAALFAAGGAAFARGDYAAALDSFLAAQAAGAASAALTYNIAVCRYRLGQLDAAESSFRVLADEHPAFDDLASYNIGLVELARGDTVRARRRFESVLEASDQTLRDLATAALARITPPPAGPAAGWTRYVDFGAGHDSNVVLIEDSVLPAGSESGSGFVEALVYAAGPAGGGERWRVDLTGYAASYNDTPQYDQVALSAAGLRAFAANAWSVRIGPAVGTGQLDGDGFERRAGVQAVGERELAAAGWLRLRLQLDDVAAIDDRFAYVEGDRQSVDLSWFRNFDSGRLSLVLALETNDRAGAGVSPDRQRFALTYRFYAGPGWSFDAGVVLRNSDYDDLATPRSERLKEIALTARRALGPQWQLSIGARAADNASSDPVFDYSRTRVAVGLNRVF